MARKSPSDQGSGVRIIRLGQITLWEDTDLRIEKRIARDGVETVQFIELRNTPTPPGVNRKPNYDPVWTGNWEGMVALSNLLNAIIDDADDTGGKNLPIEMSTNYPHSKENGGDEHGKT